MACSRPSRSSATRPSSSSWIRSRARAERERSSLRASWSRVMGASRSAARIDRVSFESLRRRFPSSRREIPQREREGSGEGLQDVGGSEEGGGALLDQAVRTLAGGRGDGARNGEDIDALVCRVPCGDQRAASLAGFDDDHSQGRGADQAVAEREVGRTGRGARRQLAHHRAGAGDPIREEPMNRRIDPIGPTGLERHGETPGLEGSLMGRGIHAHGETGYDHQPGPCECRGQIPCHGPPVVRGRPGADDRHCRRPKHRRVAPDHQERRSVDQPTQTLGIGDGGEWQEPRADSGELPRAPAELPLRGRCHRAAAQQSLGVRTRRQGSARVLGPKCEGTLHREPGVHCATNRCAGIRGIQDGGEICQSRGSPGPGTTDG